MPLPTRRLIGLAPLLLAESLLVQPLTAQAALSCRSDPIATLSNGVQVQMSNTIYDNAANVSKVAYTLHGPAGTTVTSVVYPSDNTSGIAETLQYFADNGAGNYDSYSAIYDNNTGINIRYFTTATNTVTGASLSQMAQTHLSNSGQVLHIHLHLM
jgi:hypothetical protein